MWTPEHRAAARRQDLRYASDLTDEEWALVAPMIPPARRGGRPRDVNMREVINGLLYLLWTGCQWQALPKDLPPKSTVHHFQAVGLGRHAGAHPLCALCGGARASGPRGKPERGNHRQSKRQDGAKRCYGASGEDNGTIVAPANQWSAPCHSRTI